MRTHNWLEDNLEFIWEAHFSDIEKKNPIEIRFGRRSQRRLGSIILTKEKVSLITLTGYFTDEQIPDYVLFETIAHELIHYIHGFSSTLDRQFKYPHQGGIIAKEMRSRGLGEIHTKSKEWLSENWTKYLKSNKINPNPPKKRKRRRSRRKLIKILIRRKILI